MVLARTPFEETIFPSFTSTSIAPQRAAVSIVPAGVSAHAGSGIAEDTTMAPAVPPAVFKKLRRVNFIILSLNEHGYDVRLTGQHL